MRTLFSETERTEPCPACGTREISQGFGPVCHICGSQIPDPEKSDVDKNIQSVVDHASKPIIPESELHWSLSSRRDSSKDEEIGRLVSAALKSGDGDGCVICHGTVESVEYSGTCAGCGISSTPGHGDLAAWLEEPQRKMRCQLCRQKTMSKMPDGEYKCYACESKTEEKEQRPTGAMLGDFLGCEKCGSKKIKVFSSLAKCLECNEALVGDLAKLSVIQLKSWQTKKTEMLDDPKIKVFDMRELASKIEHMDSDDSDSKGRIKGAVKKLAIAGEYRELSVPKLGWSDLLHVFAEMHPNFIEVIEMSVRPSLAIAAADGISRPAPVLLLGEPGVGKSFFAECLARHLDVPSLKIDMSVSTNGSSLAGSSAFWSNSSPGDVFKILAFGSPGKAPTANPVIFIDEVDKVNDRMDYNPLAGLYSLLEIESARHFEDQSITGIHLDASHIRWLLACNLTKDIPAPILSRVHVFEIPELTSPQKRQMFARIFQMVVEGTGLQDFYWQLPEKIIKPLQDMGMREFKNLAGVAIGRALEDGRWQVEANDFRRTGLEVVKVPMGFR